MTMLNREKLICPSCQTEFYASTLASYGTVGSYTDFCPVYSGAPAIFNLLASCPMCEFTAYIDKFEILPQGEGTGLGQWDEKEEPEDLFGPGKFLKAVETYKKLGASNSITADLYLKAFWCFHYGKFPKADPYFILRKAIFHFQEALDKKEVPEGQEAEYLYLIGELSRRGGRFAEAVEWFGKAADCSVRTRHKGGKTDADLVKLARRMKDLAEKSDASEQTV
jgi:uncharacterized protein (DUF2225 family)